MRAFDSQESLLSSSCLRHLRVLLHLVYCLCLISVSFLCGTIHFQNLGEGFSTTALLMHKSSVLFHNCSVKRAISVVVEEAEVF